ncbi:hypothetical protein B0T18DRAFT_32901 [Schizothecium vesticola]|uniref:RRM domain-containing protein n=1 Tax=Schizothecium vesticola TaxID=314040 RepID=A0AA40KCJ6_9PEZI|nr:hypothetical protein B0T18DRAFT_32901 [Schizothecium vesticola]
MSNRQPSRVVFVGNIPYGLTEEQITEIFSGAGRVINFRLVYDRETGRPKGFGFAEFPDNDSAASAVRNLNDHEIMGRKLRVDFSNEPASDEQDGRDRDGPPGNANPNIPSYAQPPNGASNQPAMAPGGLPPLPQGKELPTGVTSTDAISRTLNTLPPAQLLDVLQQMRTLATTDPARCAELLNLAPQLSYAVFQAMLLMGLVSPDAINSVLETPIAVPPPAAAAAAPPYGYNPAPVPTPPYGAGQGYAPPPAQAPAPAAAQEGLGDIIDALLKLTPEEINSLNPEDREQVLAILAAHGR